MPLLVNSEYVDDSLIRSEAEAVSRQLLDENPGEDELSLQMRIWERARENVIARVLLKQAAFAATAPPVEDEVEAAVRQIRAQAPGESGCIFLGPDEQLRSSVEADLRIEQFLDQITAGAAHPTSSEIASYYRRHRDLFRHPEFVHVSHIVRNVDENTGEASAHAQMEQAARAIEQGVPFARLADQLSDCPGRGGDLGFCARGDMVEEFEAVVFALRQGEVSGIFRTPFGFHIATLHEKVPEGIWPLAAVRNKIGDALLQDRKRAIAGQFAAKLRQSAKIERVSANEARI